MDRIKEWLKRYLPAELLSLAATLAAASFTFQLTGSQVKTALAGTWGGNLAYFGLILFRDVWQTRQAGKALGHAYRWATFQKNVRALAIEFGMAEIADSFFIRPLLMFYLPLWLGSLSVGMLVAKLAADVTFYVPAIISYELSKNHFRKFH